MLLCNHVTVQHDDPFTCRSLRLIVQIDDMTGALLDTPEPVRVLSVTIATGAGDPETTVDVKLSPCAAEAILREFEGRLRVDDDLRQWLRQITFPAAFGTSPEPVRDEEESK